MFWGIETGQQLCFGISLSVNDTQLGIFRLFLAARYKVSNLDEPWSLMLKHFFHFFFCLNLPLHPLPLAFNTDLNLGFVFLLLNQTLKGACSAPWWNRRL